MKKFIISAALVATLMFPLTGIASAESPHHTFLGTPGEPDCVGETTAYYAQLVKTYGYANVYQPGVGNLGPVIYNSPQQLHANIRAYCNSSPV